MSESSGSKEGHPDQGMVVLNKSVPFVTDRYRSLFAKIDLISRKEDKKLIAITSAVKGEGKTTTTSNLAVVSARDFGKRSLIIDGDYKNPSVEKCFGVSHDLGLLNVIAKECNLMTAVVKGPVDNLALLTMGSLPNRENDNQEMNVWTENGIRSILKEVRQWFDYVWIDAPPILPLFDMSIISEEVDGVVLVIKTGETPEAVLAQAVKSLGSRKIIGSVLNRAKAGWKNGYGRSRHGYDDNY